MKDRNAATFKTMAQPLVMEFPKIHVRNGLLQMICEIQTNITLLYEKWEYRPIELQFFMEIFHSADILFSAIFKTFKQNKYKTNAAPAFELVNINNEKTKI